MPEFEKNQSQPDPENHYSPSKNTSKKTGGRRRSGGFKTEIAPSTSGIGEVDPSEISKDENLSGNTQSSEPSSQQNKNKDTHSASEDQKDTEVDNDSKKVLKKTSTPQPSEATLAAIKKVEAAIAKREEEERGKGGQINRADRKTKSDQRRTNSKNNRKSVPKSGLFAKIAQFFNNLFGNTCSKSGHSRSKNNGRRTASKSYNGKKQIGHSRSRQKNNSQHRSGKNRPRNERGSTVK